ncbi:MAG: Holliday junction branch migration DNA helicase RuvB [Candidatus Sungbacteria bacterium]|nr:Holliday junction branch migration DNA helicase RuvB [Candidatus Sungbacteria bacterium]
MRPDHTPINKSQKTTPVVLAEKSVEDKNLDTTLRPQKWSDYVGQDLLKKNLRILIDAARKRNEPLEHVLLGGPAGLGKTSMAHLIAREMQTNIRVTSGPAIERVGDLASILTNLLPGEILFIDEAHRLNKLIEEVLYPAMESRTLDIVIGKGPSARTIQIELPPFTLIAATTRIGLLSSPLRSRFGGAFRLDFYADKDIEKIIERSAGLLNIAVEARAVKLLAAASRFTPRVANRLLKRARDYAQVHGDSIVTGEVAQKTLSLLGIDASGLEPMDRRVLEVIIKKFGGGPVGLSSIAAASSEEEDTIEDVYEPYLMQLGLLERTTRGRVATERAYAHLGLASMKQKPLLS